MQKPRSLSLCTKPVIVLTDFRESVYYCTLAFGHAGRCPYPYHRVGRKYLVEDDFYETGTYYRGGKDDDGLSGRERARYL